MSLHAKSDTLKLLAAVQRDIEILEHAIVEVKDEQFNQLEVKGHIDTKNPHYVISRFNIHVHAETALRMLNVLLDDKQKTYDALKNQLNTHSKNELI